MKAFSSAFRPLLANFRYVAISVTVLAVLLFIGYGPRYARRRTLEREASRAQLTLPQAKVVVATAQTGPRSLTLPGSMQAVRQALVFARATGYVTRWNVDLGDRVRTGDPLAELDTPELKQQLLAGRAQLKQKKAALAQALANQNYARVTVKRSDALLLEGLITKQDDDQANAQLQVGDANVHAAQADVDAAAANVRELAELVSFGHVSAPFDGRVTERNIDVGSLVTIPTGAMNASSGQAMFRIEAIDPIRVFVQVPQTFALNVKPGQAASVSIRQLPGRLFTGRVTRTAGTIDPASRTLNTEIDVPNPQALLLAGMFAEVTIEVELTRPVVRVPSSAVINDARGEQTATVDRAGYVHLVAVKRGIDNGREVDLVDGLAGGEEVMVSPGANVVNGMRVAALREL
ncbi:MAG TPA: efflux RND transporter periplasmic adaptor subunit [Polyangiaceae bacterium]